MLKTILALIIFCGTIPSQAQITKPKAKYTGKCCMTQIVNESNSKLKATKAMKTVTQKKIIACKLTSPELQKRKQEVLAILEDRVLSKSELENGYKYEFDGSDKMFDELVSFIKSERTCCDFFTFELSISDNNSNIWLSITGPDGAKNFIEEEMDL